MVFWIVSQCCNLKFQNPMLYFNIQTWVCYNSRMVLSNIVFIYIPAWILQITLLGSYITNVVLCYPRSYLYIFQGWSFKITLLGSQLTNVVLCYPRLYLHIFQGWIGSCLHKFQGWILPNYIIGSQITNVVLCYPRSYLYIFQARIFLFTLLHFGITKNQCIVVLAKVVFICIPSLDFQIT